MVMMAGALTANEECLGRATRRGSSGGFGAAIIAMTGSMLAGVRTSER